MSDILIGVIVFGLVFRRGNIRHVSRKESASSRAEGERQRPSFAEASTFAEATARQDGVPSKLSEADKLDLQRRKRSVAPTELYALTRCYGSLTTFNALFKNKDDPNRRLR